MSSALRGKRVLILIGGHLATAPRPQKEASALRAAGAEVLIRGTWWSNRFAAEDEELAGKLGVEYCPLVDLRPGVRGRLVNRLKHRVARELLLRFKLARPRALGVGALEFLREARRIKPDLVIAHSEAALWAVSELTTRNGQSFPTGVDMEDWFSEDLPPESRRQGPANHLKGIESRVLRGAACSFCPSRAMSAALAAEYDCQPPTVIYNAFPWADRKTIDGRRKDRGNSGQPSIHWYSQTIGAGRGLEDLFAALPYVKEETEIHLRGNQAGGFDEWMRSRVPEAWRARVFLHPPVPNVELLSRIAEHDIGFAGEMRHSRSRNLTVTNKILHYLLAGLAVVASDTAGQKEIASQSPSAVFVYPSGDAHGLAEQFNLLLGASQRMLEVKKAALQAAEGTFCWERFAPALVERVETAVRQR